MFHMLDTELDLQQEGPTRPTTTPPSMSLDRFAFDSFALTQSHYQLIRRIVRRVATSWRTAAPVRMISLIGYTDSRGPNWYNRGLGLRRARAVQAVIARLLERVHPGLAGRIKFVAESLGSAQPLTVAGDQAARARNRRVSVRLDSRTRTSRPPLAGLEGGRERLPEAPVTAVTVPSLLFTDATVPSETHYVAITLGGESPAPTMTGIFVPSSYRIPSQVDILLYLQGNHTGKRELSIEEYWDRFRHPFWRFREGVNTSNKNVILVAPTLGPLSQGRNLTRSGGLSWYLDQVMAALRAYGPLKGISDLPPLGDLIIACHSGGGTPMRMIALAQQKYLSNVRQFWGFDCLNDSGDETRWVDWARANPNKRLFIHYAPGTAAISQRLQLNARLMPNVTVAGPDTVPHDHVPITHWHERLRAARFLLDR
jgi:outer membrane protein OmpA-like peptidoglycan-associated protein